MNLANLRKYYDNGQPSGIFIKSYLKRYEPVIFQIVKHENLINNFKDEDFHTKKRVLKQWKKKLKSFCSKRKLFRKWNDWLSPKRMDEIDSVIRNDEKVQSWVEIQIEKKKQRILGAMASA